MYERGFVNQRLQKQKRLCFTCGKPGHSKQDCKHREHVKRTEEVLPKEPLCKQKHLNNIIINGIPVRENLKVTDVVQALTRRAKISCKEYEVNTPWPNDVNRFNEVRVAFKDETVKGKFMSENHKFMFDWSFKKDAKGFPLNYGKETFMIRCRNEEFPMMEEVFSKSLELQKNFVGLELKYKFKYQWIAAEYGDCHWALHSLKDVGDLRATLVKIKNGTIKENFNNTQPRKKS